MFLNQSEYERARAQLLHLGAHDLGDTRPACESDDERDAMTKLREADTRDYREKVNRYKATY